MNTENIRGKHTFPPRLMEEVTMDEQLQQEINKLLEHLESQEDTTTSQPSEGRQETEVIDVFIVHRQVEEEEPPTVKITMTRTITVIPAHANAAQQQIPGRPLATITLSQAKTVPTTGRGHEPAQAAHGLVTFYNALPAPQTIPAGELLTGADGVAVVTLQDAMIPAGTLATNGQITVPAQAVNIGHQVNIASNDIYGKSCRDNVFVSNGSFRVSQTARSSR